LEKRRPLNWTNMLSISEHLDFPAFFNPTAGPVVAYLVQLMQTQYMPGRAIFRRQLLQLSLRLQHAKRQSPYFAPLLKNIDFKNPKSVMQGFNNLPLLTRSILQDRVDDIFIKSPANHGKTSDKSTSGSTGQPVMVRTTAVAFALRGALTLRAHWCQGLDFSEKFAAIRANITDIAGNPMKTEGKGWGGGVFRTGETGAMSSSYPLDEQIEWLEKLDPAYLMTYPSNLNGLLLATPNRKPKNLKAVITLGETVSPELRQAAQEIWQVPIYDRYSSEELGMIAVECQDGQYHLMSENLIVEILDDDGRPCRPGEIGRVIATDLQNFATALIRYETKDYAEVGTPCTCGIRLPTIKRILGRVRNMVTKPDGSKMWPRLGLRDIREALPVKQFQAIQKTLCEIEIRLHVERPLTDNEKEQLRQKISSTIGEEFNLEFVYFDRELPKGSNGKFEEFMSMV
jgi:phenylacetate-CoA ligase